MLTHESPMGLPMGPWDFDMPSMGLRCSHGFAMDSSFGPWNSRGSHGTFHAGVRVSSFTPVGLLYVSSGVSNAGPRVSPTGRSCNFAK